MTYESEDGLRWSRVSDGSVLPGELAPMGTRTAALLVPGIGQMVLSYIPVIGWAVWLVVYAVNLILYRRGHDIGARLFKLRIVRDSGEIAGFYHVYARAFAMIISLLAIGAGFWTAYGDRNSQTWHDKMLGTYVIKDDPSLNDKDATSSDGAKIVFWITAPLLVLLTIAFPSYVLGYG